MGTSDKRSRFYIVHYSMLSNGCFLSALPKRCERMFFVAVSKAVNGCFLFVVPKKYIRIFFVRRSPMEQKDESILLLMRRIANYPINAKEKKSNRKEPCGCTAPQVR